MANRKPTSSTISKEKRKVSSKNLKKISGGKDKSHIDIRDKIGTATAPKA